MPVSAYSLMTIGRALIPQRGARAAAAVPRRPTGESGEVSFERIEVQPFEIERFWERFGLIAKFDDGASMWRVSAEPGNYMAFSEPRDTGDSDNRDHDHVWWDAVREVSRTVEPGSRSAWWGSPVRAGAPSPGSHVVARLLRDKARLTAAMATPMPTATRNTRL